MISGILKRFAQVVFVLLLQVPVMFISAVLTVITAIVRTALEERTLLEELDGYKEYTMQARHRLLPGIW